MAVRTSRIPVKVNPAVRKNGVLRTPTQNLAHWSGEEVKQWSQYWRCAGDNVKDGKTFYHSAGAAFFPSAVTTKNATISTTRDCSSNFEAWKKAALKVEEYGGKVMAKRLAEGKLLAPAEERLTEIVETAHSISTTGLIPRFTVPHLSPTEQSATTSASEGQLTAEEQAAADALLLEEEGMGMGTYALLGLGAVAAAGGAYWYVTKEPAAEGAEMAGAEAGEEGEGGMSTMTMGLIGVGVLAAIGGIYWYMTPAVDEMGNPIVA